MPVPVALVVMFEVQMYLFVARVGFFFCRYQRELNVLLVLVSGGLGQSESFQLCRSLLRHYSLQFILKALDMLRSRLHARQSSYSTPDSNNWPWEWDFCYAKTENTIADVKLEPLCVLKYNCMLWH